MQQPPPQSDPPTVDLEAEPNTAHYPPAPKYKVVRPPAANAQQNNPEQPQGTSFAPAQSNSQAPAPTTQPVPRLNNLPQFPAPASSQTTKPAGPNALPPAATAPAQSQNHGLIGPPAPAPPTPEQMPPSPPRITYQDGLLCVESTNSRLSDILNGIRSRTGIQFEGIQSAGDRVAGKFGPAPASEVLTNLLEGARFDYVIVGTPENPDIVQRVILTPNAAGGGNVPGAPQGQPVAAAKQTSDEDEGDEEPAETQQVQAPQPGAPVQPAPPAPGPRTTEQLLEELKRNQAQNQNQQNAGQANTSQPSQPTPPIKRRPPTQD